MIDIEVGREYSITEVRNICLADELFDVVYILDHDPPDKPFKSDGCSCCPELWNGVLITPYCVAHDLRYWCGLPGDEAARFQADVRLMELVAKATQDYVFAAGMFNAVRIGGREGTGASYQWGYGRS